jgi:hypothetical protein
LTGTPQAQRWRDPFCLLFPNPSGEIGPLFRRKRPAPIHSLFSACQTSLGSAEFSCISSREFREMLRIFKVLAVLTLSLVGQIAVAQEPPPTPALPKPLSVTRFVPSGEEWTVGQVTALNPDCSSKGPIVGRVVEHPAHGEVAFEPVDIFPTFLQTSPLFACNSKRALGLMVKYRSEPNFIG